MGKGSIIANLSRTASVFFTKPSKRASTNDAITPRDTAPVIKAGAMPAFPVRNDFYWKNPTKKKSVVNLGFGPVADEQMPILQEMFAYLRKGDVNVIQAIETAIKSFSIKSDVTFYEKTPIKADVGYYVFLNNIFYGKTTSALQLLCKLANTNKANPNLHQTILNILCRKENNKDLSNIEIAVIYNQKNIVEAWLKNKAREEEAKKIAEEAKRKEETTEEEQQANTSHEKAVDQYMTDGKTLSLWAAELGHTDMLRLLKTYGANHQLARNNGDHEACETALMLAAQNGHEDAVKMLLSLEDPAMDPNISNDSLDANVGDNALTFAVAGGHAKIVELLMQSKNIRLDVGLNHDILAIAVAKGNLAVVDVLLKNKNHKLPDQSIDPRRQLNLNVLASQVVPCSSSLFTALAAAIVLGHTEVVKRLLEEPEINVFDANEKHAFDVAVSRLIQESSAEGQKKYLEILMYLFLYRPKEKLAEAHLSFLVKKYRLAITEVLIDMAHQAKDAESSKAWLKSAKQNAMFKLIWAHDKDCLGMVDAELKNLKRDERPHSISDFRL